MPERIPPGSGPGPEWVVLGAGAILPRAGYGCAGHALVVGDEVTLFDCGPGTLRSLAEAGIGLERVRRVVVSHFHPDHVLDLFALAFARRNPAFEAPALELIGPRGTRALVESGAGELARWTRLEPTQVIEVEPALEVRQRELPWARLSWVATEHAPEALAWRVELPTGATAAYSGDSGERPQLAALARGVDALVCECSFPDEQAVEHHLSPRSAARVARRAGVGRLILTHFYPSMDPARAAREAAAHFAGPVEASRDRSRHALHPFPHEPRSS